ncbi:TIGR00341 family protein [Leptolyngbya iicbica]|uniref:TIGR00341 family protein n=2 Tax=Cyanophyceae TaxID=3028117 RepID=A0A4Q7EAG8_9CYAN|nr:TIGR00341 family protein [Leptolyngbya sp. LK]RZM79608.1 TIGR00341 family protein [Leptolyngbya sp. LK]
MSLRLIEVFLPDDCTQQVETLLADQTIINTWYEPRFQDQVWVRILVQTQDAETIVDQFFDQFHDIEGFRLLLLVVEASLPNSDQEDREVTELPSKSELKTDLNPQLARINREEIYDRVAQSANLSWVQLAMVILSTLIAAIGILRDSQAVVIGAMVIAPLLKPNMGLAVATTLGDRQLALRTIGAGTLGILLSLVLSIGIGNFADVALTSTEITSRLRVGWPDGILALASGIAGAIALTTEERSSLVGVMVSVALLPPLVVLGLMVGAGYWSEALGAGLLTITNLICLNLAAVTTFWVQDLRPRQQHDVPEAKRVTQFAYSIWLLLLVGLIGTVIVVRMYGLHQTA